MGPIFDRLVASFPDKKIYFFRFDATTDDTRERSGQRLEELWGVTEPELFNQMAAKTGQIALGTGLIYILNGETNESIEVYFPDARFEDIRDLIAQVAPPS
jgi:hypothetical protein